MDLFVYGGFFLIVHPRILRNEKRLTLLSCSHLVVGKGEPNNYLMSLSNITLSPSETLPITVLLGQGSIGTPQMKGDKSR